jgi:hypothetical protein
VLTNAAKSRDGSQAGGARLRLAALPQVNGLTCCPNKEAEVRCAQAETLAIGGQPRGAETGVPFLRFRGLGLPGLVCQPSQRLYCILELQRSSLERCDFGSLGRDSLLEALGFTAQFLTSQAGDFRLECGCEIGHVPNCAPGYPLRAKLRRRCALVKPHLPAMFSAFPH